ncbi:hypothetical protein STAIW_v1c05460 [Spiroplasma taiwanense CT-1]|uniref:Acetyltransferase n=1 Tax=Spiroplasma taiwanense CT-1 TaxID=1276220 RepID=S5LX14_9MOLU|nr:hypothetical protein STAIW_v1c05460 [Spiroplasma taiwanense CT-1]
MLSKITNKPIPEGFWFLAPIYIDYGKNLILGKNSFINFGCSFLDRGGIEIGDNTLIGPNCNLMTTNHPIDPKERRSTISKKNSFWGKCLIRCKCYSVSRSYNWKKFNNSCWKCCYKRYSKEFHSWGNSCKNY